MSSPAPTTEAAIWLALRGRAETLALPGASLPLIDPNALIPPPAADGKPVPFLALSDIRSAPERLTIGPEAHRRSGVFQVSVQWPLAIPITHTAFLNLAGAVAAHFPADLRLRFGDVCLRVASAPEIVAPFTEGAYRQAPVRAPWTTI